MLPPQPDVTIFFLQISFFSFVFFICTHVGYNFFYWVFWSKYYHLFCNGLNGIRIDLGSRNGDVYIITSASDVMANCHTTKRLRQQKRRHDQAGVTWSSARGSSPPSSVHSSNGRAEFSDQVCYPAATSAATCGSACHTPVLFLRRWCHGLTQIGSRKGDFIKLWLSKLNLLSILVCYRGSDS